MASRVSRAAGGWLSEASLLLHYTHFRTVEDPARPWRDIARARNEWQILRLSSADVQRIRNSRAPLQTRHICSFIPWIRGERERYGDHLVYHYSSPERKEMRGREHVTSACASQTTTMHMSGNLRRCCWHQCHESTHFTPLLLPPRACVYGERRHTGIRARLVFLSSAQERCTSWQMHRPSEAEVSAVARIGESCNACTARPKPINEEVSDAGKGIVRTLRTAEDTTTTTTEKKRRFNRATYHVK